MSPIDLISVIVTTYNRSDAVIQVLKGLAQQGDSNFEVVIADDGSNEEHRDAIRAAARGSGLHVIHVWHPDIGFTASRVRNRGVSVSQGDYILLLDGDCVPETDFVSRHRRLREKGCFVNGSRVLLSPALTKSVLTDLGQVFGRSAWYWVRKRWAGEASKLAGLLRLPDFAWRKRKAFFWRGIRSCNMGVWRADFEAVNGFDESFVGWGHEDADFVLRLHNLGVVRKNGFYSTEVYHLWHAEASRGRESVNAERVRERMGTHQVRSTVGYLESMGGTDMVVNRLE